MYQNYIIINHKTSKMLIQVEHNLQGYVIFITCFKQKDGDMTFHNHFFYHTRKYCLKLTNYFIVIIVKVFKI